MRLRATAPKHSGVAGLLLPLAVLSGGCGDSSTGGVVVIGPVPDQVIVTPVTRTLLIGESAQLSASVLDEDGAAIVAATVTWASQNPTLATVTSAGLVTGVSAGITLVTATAQSGGGEASGSSAITVEDDVQAGAAGG